MKIEEEGFSALIVDREKIVCDVLAEILSYNGYRAKKVFDYCEALKEIASNSFELILSEIKVPSAPEALDFAMKIRELSPKADLVIVSSFDELQNLEILKESGDIFSYIIKPFDYNSVFRVLKEVDAKRKTVKNGVLESEELKYRNLRKHWRLSDRLRVDFVIWNPGEWVSDDKVAGTASTNNISPLGACMSIPYCVKPDFVSAMSFHFPQFKSYACATGEVRWVKSAGNFCEIGVEFISIDNDSKDYIIEHMQKEREKKSCQV